MRRIQFTKNIYAEFLSDYIINESDTVEVTVIKEKSKTLQETFEEIQTIYNGAIDNAIVCDDIENKRFRLVPIDKNINAFSSKEQNCSGYKLIFGLREI